MFSRDRNVEQGAKGQDGGRQEGTDCMKKVDTETRRNEGGKELMVYCKKD